MDLLILSRKIIQMKQTVLKIGYMNVIHHGPDVTIIGNAETDVMSWIAMYPFCHGQHFQRVLLNDSFTALIKQVDNGNVIQIN
jgi:hypothetical protein